MKKRRRDPVREDRIHNEAIVDAYGPEEQATGWYYYLENKVRSPLLRHSGRIAHQRSIELTHFENRIGNRWRGAAASSTPQACFDEGGRAGDVIHAVGVRVGFSSSV